MPPRTVLDPSTAVPALDVAVGAVFLAAALASALVLPPAARRRAAPALTLLGAVGATWLAGDLVPALVLIHRGPLVHVLVTFPRARPCRPVLLALVAVGYVDAVLAGAYPSPVATALLASAVALTVVVRFLTATGSERRARFAAAVSGLGVSAVLLYAAAARAPSTAIATAYDLALLLSAPTLAVAVSAWARNQGVVRELVIQLGAARGHEAEALLQSWQSDPALATDPSITASIGALHELLAANARLTAQARAATESLAASRRRLLEVDDRERARFANEIRRGVDRHLTSVIDLVPPQPELDHLRDRARACRAELDRLARGVHPDITSAAALHTQLLANAAPVPVEIRVADIDLDATTGVCLYYVCSEAVANAVKHAAANRIRVAVYATADSVHATVDDDGAGGADLSPGSGLDGLRDRVHALSGELRIDSPPRGGTRVIVNLPIRRHADLRAS